MYVKMDALLMAHNYAKAAIDVAVMDMMGKHYGVRVCDLLGGAETERLPAYYATGIGEQFRQDSGGGRHRKMSLTAR